MDTITGHTTGPEREENIKFRHLFVADNVICHYTSNGLDFSITVYNMEHLLIPSDNTPGGKGHFSTITFRELSNLSLLIQLCQREQFQEH